MNNKLIISEIFFGDLNNNAWFEICNLSNEKIELQHPIIFTNGSKLLIDNDFTIESESAISISGFSSETFNNKIDSLILADKEGNIICVAKWDINKLDIDNKSLYSIEINNTAIAPLENNWIINKGKGKPGLLPASYSKSNNTIDYMLIIRYLAWSIAIVILILIINSYFFRNRKKN